MIALFGMFIKVAMTFLWMLSATIALQGEREFGSLYQRKVTETKKLSVQFLEGASKLTWKDLFIQLQKEILTYLISVELVLYLVGKGYLQGLLSVGLALLSTVAIFYMVWICIGVVFSKRAVNLYFIVIFTFSLFWGCNHLNNIAILF